MTLSLSWTQRLKGTPTSYRDCIADFFNTHLATLTHWATGFALNSGLQGGGFTRVVDGMECCLFNWITGDPTGTGATANPGGSTNARLSMVGSASLSTQSNGMEGAAINKGAAFFDAAVNCMGENGITAIFFTQSSRTGFFIRGETLNVAGGTYAAPIIECFHDGINNGMLIIGAWSTGTPTATNINGAALAGATSGATATANALTGDRTGNLCWWRLKAQDTYFLTSVSGATPTGTITGGTTGFTATFSTYTAASAGKLVVTGGTGRFLHGEVLTWTGGSATVEHVPFGCEMASVSDLLIPTPGIETDASGYLVGEDADRLVLLFPNIGGGDTTYKVFMFGKWAEDLRGGGPADCVILSNGAELPAQAGNNGLGGIIIEPRDQSVQSIAAAVNFVPHDTFMAGAGGSGSIWAPARMTGANNEVSNYDASASDFLIAGRRSRQPSRFLAQNPADVVRPAYLLRGLFTGPTPSGFKALLTHPDGTSRYGLQIDSGATGIFLDFDDASIVP